MFGVEFEECCCSFIFYYENVEDKEVVVCLVFDCVSYVNDVCELQCVYVVVVDNFIIVELVDWIKGMVVQKVFEMMQKKQLDIIFDFMMVIGDGCEDEKVFKWVNKLDKEKLV